MSEIHICKECIYYVVGNGPICIADAKVDLISGEKLNGQTCWAKRYPGLFIGCIPDPGDYPQTCPDYKQKAKYEY